MYCGSQHYSLLKAGFEIKYKYILRKEDGVFDELHKVVCSHIYRLFSVYTVNPKSVDCFKKK